MRDVKIGFLLIFLISGFFSVAQWTIIDTLNVPRTCSQGGLTNPVNIDIFFTGNDVGYFTASSGGCSPSNPSYSTVVKTINGYTSWASCFPGIGIYSHIQGSFFLNNDTGFVAYYSTSSRFMQTLDGGNTWVKLSDTNITHLFFVNVNLGFGMGYGSLGYGLWKFSNGALSSISIINNIDELAGIKLYFIDSLNGYILGASANHWNKNQVLKTADGGLTWNTSLYNPIRAYNDIAFSSDSVGYLASDTGIYKTTNSGLTWNLIDSTNHANVISLSVLSDSVIFGLSNYSVLNSKDGGLNWSTDALPPNTVGMQIKMFNDTSGYVLGQTNLSPSGQMPYIVDVMLKKTTVPAVEPPVEEKNFSYPNPTDGVFKLVLPPEYENTEFTLKIYDVMLKEIQKPVRFLYNDPVQIDLTGKNAGMYIIQMNSGDKNYTGKIIVK